MTAYVVIAIVALAIGFVAGWLVTGKQLKALAPVVETLVRAIAETTVKGDDVRQGIAARALQLGTKATLQRLREKFEVRDK